MNPIESALSTSMATEPKQSTWIILGERFAESSFRLQEQWLNDKLKRAGFDPNEWKKTGEMPSEMICRFARKAEKSIDEFLLDVTRS